MEVFIDADLREDDCWELSFQFHTPEFLYEFVATEPYMISFDDWMKLVETKEHSIYLYQGNGEGSITRKGSKYEFVSNTSGAGGDTSSFFRVDATKIDTKLAEVLHHAKFVGFTFSDRCNFFVEESLLVK